MKLTIGILIASLFSIGAQAKEMGNSFKTPKVIVFSPKDKPKIVVKMLEKLVLPYGPLRTSNEEEPTHSCDIKFYNVKDRKLTVAGHPHFSNGNSSILIDGDEYRVTSAYGSGSMDAFESKWHTCQTFIYETSEECKQQVNPIRFLLGIYRGHEEKYTNAIDAYLAWERDNDTATLYKDGQWGREFVANGTVEEWHP